MLEILPQGVYDPRRSHETLLTNSVLLDQGSYQIHAAEAMSLLRLWPVADTQNSPGAVSGAPHAEYISSEGVVVSSYNPELVRDDPNFLFHLELSKLVQDT